MNDEGRVDELNLDSNGRTSTKIFLWLSQPLREVWCFIGWILATSVFFAVTKLMGGPTQGDVAVSAYSTWSIAHGHLACAYSPPSTHPFPTFASPYTLIAPLYPLVSGAILGITHRWGDIPFPTTAQLGPNCSHAFDEMFKWSLKSNVIVSTIDVGYLMWFPLLIGAILLLRATKRGGTRWEPVTLIGLALLPPLLECLLMYFHPQDILALGLALSSLAFGLRGKWIWAGVMLGLAFTSNQFVLLIAVPLVVVIPNRERIKWAIAAAVGVAIIVLPLAVVTTGRSLRWSVIGSSYVAPPKGIAGGTLMRDIPLSPNELLLCARILPLVGAMFLAFWAKRRLGEGILNAVPLLSLVATALSLRLVCEVNLWGYYFAGSALFIVINEVVQGRVRGQVIAWLALLTLAFNPVPWGFATNGQSWGLSAIEAMPNVFVICALLIILIDALHGRVRWYIISWFVLVCLTLVKNPYSHAALRTAMPNWFWQVVLVPITFGLAVSPLIKSVRAMKETSGAAEGAVRPEFPSS